jgi:hypothetical protein
MKCIPNFWKSWSWLVASVGVVLPEALQMFADHSSLIPFIDAEYKDAIRLIALVLVVMLRPIPQKALRNEG